MQRDPLVFGFDPTNGGIRSYFSHPRKAVLNNLTTLQPLMGYWLHTSAAAALPLTGTPLPSGTSLTLAPGWNLVGFAGEPNTPLVTALARLNSGYDIVVGFDPTDGGATSYFTDSAKSILNNLSVMEPQAGYWIHITSPTALIWPAR